MILESRREREQRLRRQRRSGIAGIMLAFMLVAVIGIAIWNGKQMLAQRNAEYEEREAQLRTQIQEQEERKAQLEEYAKYMQTKQFVEEIAKEKFGLIYPDEMILKAE